MKMTKKEREVQKALGLTIADYHVRAYFDGRRIFSRTVYDVHDSRAAIKKFKEQYSMALEARPIDEFEFRATKKRKK